MEILKGYKTYLAGYGLIVLNVVLLAAFLLGVVDRDQAHAAVDQVWDYSMRFQALSNMVLGGAIIFLRMAIAKASG